VSEEIAPQEPAEPAAKPGAVTGATVLDFAGGILGLVVFVIGVVLVVASYRQAGELYTDIGPAIDAARVGPSEPARSTAAPGGTETGPVVASPGGKPLVKVGLELALRFLAVLVIAFLGFLVAVMGAKLAGAHRGKRT
jgi:hypothetical protein